MHVGGGGGSRSPPKYCGARGGGVPSVEVISGRSLGGRDVVVDSLPWSLSGAGRVAPRSVEGDLHMEESSPLHATVDVEKKSLLQVASAVSPPVSKVCAFNESVRQDVSAGLGASAMDIGDASVMMNAGTLPSLAATAMDMTATFVPAKGMPGVCPNASEMGSFFSASTRTPVGNANIARNGNETANAWNRPKVVPLPVQGDLDSLLVDGKSIQLDEDTLDSNIKKFEFAIVGRLFGKRIPFHFLHSELTRRWNVFGHFRLLTIASDCFVCFFDNCEAKNAVLMGGPWVIAGQVLGLDVWSPSFSPSSSDGFITPVWVRLPNLPMYCWDVQSIARITTYLGEPLWVDLATERMERAAFARVCVKINLAKPLPPGVWVRSSKGRFFQPVEYEGLSSFCFTCGHVGHKAVNCSSMGMVQDKASRVSQPILMDPKLSVPVAEVGVPALGEKIETLAESKGPSAPPFDNESPADVVETPGLGPWMLVVGRKRSPRNKKVGAVSFTGQPRKQGTTVGGRSVKTQILPNSDSRGGMASPGLNSPPLRRPSQVDVPSSSPPPSPVRGGNGSNSGDMRQGVIIQTKDRFCFGASSLPATNNVQNRNVKGRFSKTKGPRPVGVRGDQKKHKAEVRIVGGDASPIIDQ